MPAYPSPRPFIVHGHDHAFRDEVVLHFRETLRTEAPLVLDGIASAGRTIIEKFEEESAKCNLAVVLLTPDDQGITGSGLTYNTARPNVWLELGYFLAWFGRKSGRTLLIYKKGLDIPTDLAGIGYIDATDGIAHPPVAKRLEVELNHLVITGAMVPAATGSLAPGSYAISGRVSLAP